MIGVTMKSLIVVLISVSIILSPYANAQSKDAYNYGISSRNLCGLYALYIALASEGVDVGYLNLYKACNPINGASGLSFAQLAEAAESVGAHAVGYEMSTADIYNVKKVSIAWVPSNHMILLKPNLIKREIWYIDFPFKPKQLDSTTISKFWPDKKIRLLEIDVNKEVHNETIKINNIIKTKTTSYSKEVLIEPETAQPDKSPFIFDIQYLNTAKRKLTLKSYSTSCGCLKVWKIPEEFDGEKGTNIKIRYEFSNKIENEAKSYLFYLTFKEDSKLYIYKLKFNHDKAHK
jgi:hypothetical protein